MKTTNGECFIVENALGNAVTDLRNSSVKSLTLNVFVSRNLQKVSEICQALRKEINEFMPARLKELNDKKSDELTDDEKIEKDSLVKEYNAAINELLAQEVEIDYYKPNIDLSAFDKIELNYDSTSVLLLILNND